MPCLPEDPRWPPPPPAPNGLTLAQATPAPPPKPRTVPPAHAGSARAQDAAAAGRPEENVKEKHPYRDATQAAPDFAEGEGRAGDSGAEPAPARASEDACAGERPTGALSDPRVR